MAKGSSKRSSQAAAAASVDATMADAPTDRDEAVDANRAMLNDFREQLASQNPEVYEEASREAVSDSLLGSPDSYFKEMLPLVFNFAQVRFGAAFRDSEGESVSSQDGPRSNSSAR